jgi:translocation and assembly module TamB
MKTHGSIKRVLVKVLKITGWIFLTCVVLLVLVILAIRIPSVQNKITQKAISFLEEKIKTEVRLDYVSISFPKKIVLTGLYLEDQREDTLLYAGSLAIDTDLWSLTQHRIQLNDIELERLTAFIYRNPKDSAFNFDYIIDAFSDTTAVQKDTVAKPWDFSIGDVSLSKTHVSFKDPVAGNDLEVRAGTLEVDADEFDLAKSVIKVDDITLSDVYLSFVQSKVPVTEQLQDSIDTADKPFPYDLGFATITLKNVKANYAHEVLGQVLRVTMAEGEIEAERFDLKNQVIDFDKLLLSNTFISYHQQKRESTSRQAHPSTLRKGRDPAPPRPWTIVLRELELDDDIVQYYDFNKPALTSGMDFSHLWISGLNTKGHDLAWDGVNAKGDLEKISFYDKSGFTITEFQSSFILDSKSLQLNDFIFKTPWSHLAMDVRVEGDSISTLGSTYPDAEVDIKVKPSSIAFKDVSYFSNVISDHLPVKFPPGQSIAFSTSCEGTVRDLTIHNFKIAALSNTTLQIDGKVKGLPDVRNALMQITLRKFHTTSKDIGTLLPDTLIPASIQIPQWINLVGNFNGTMIKPEVTASLTSDFGGASVQAKMNLDSTVTKENYVGVIEIDQFNLGKLLHQEKTIGVLDLQASISGSGLKIDNLDALLDLDVNDFYYNGYHYEDFKLHGSMKKYFFSGEAKLADENLDFVLKGDLDYNGNTPYYKLNLDLKNADFKALQLTGRPIKARLKLDVDLETSDFKSINGNLGIRNVAVYNGESLYMVDSLLFASLDQEGKSELSIRSDIVSGDFKGTINLYSLPDAVRRHFNNYFSLRDTAYNKPVAPQNFEFSLILKNTDLLTEVLFPDLEPFTPGEIAGEFNSEEDNLDIRIDLADVTYAGISVDSIRFRMFSDKSDLTYKFGIRNVLVDTLKIAAVRLNGLVADDSIRTRFIIEDFKKNEKYGISGIINSFKDAFQFRLVRNEVRLNYEEWRAPGDNYLLIGKEGLTPHNFEISKGDERISLVLQESRDSTLSIIFNAFDLENLTSLVEGTTPADGYVDGDLNISVAEQGAFNSNLTIRNLFLMEQEWGDLALQLGRTSTGPFNMDLRLEGENAELKAAGYVITKQEVPEIHFETEINRLNLAVIEPLSFGELRNVTGQLVGNIKVEGNTKQPDIDGSITFKDARFVATRVNNQFILQDETIDIKNSGVSFDSFQVRDKNGNIAEINGEIVSNAFRSFDLDLSVRADNFQVLNSTYRNNELFYGKVGINTRARITGNSNLPKVIVTASLTNDSEFTYVVPQSEKGVLEQKGIVVFVDRDAQHDPFLRTINPADTAKSKFTGIDLSANIELTDDETFNIVIDPITGDKLSVKGNSTLTLAMDPTGNMELAGRYEVSEGSYDMSFYKLVKRKFNIEKGGSITWSGDPLNAMLDLRAIYEVETSPMELVSNQVDTNNKTEMNMYKQVLPFLVYLQIKGELLTPEISFKLDMPERERNAMGGRIYAKIQDINTRESDLNKQVFALLVLKRFMSDNPFESQGAGDVESTARRSVSKLLTEQLNRLSQNVKGVELSVDVKSYEDYSSGSAQGQTELQLGVSKSLLNDRLVVKVSGNVDVEGETSQQHAFTDYIGDLALEYKLTEDGRFRITGFRNSNYDMIDGELIETGAGLIYIKDYDTLRELFRNNAKED